MNVTLKICTYAVLFGTDESIIGIQLGNGFDIIKMSMIPGIDHMDNIFNRSAMELRRDYEEARIDKELNVLCVKKEVNISCDADFCEDVYRQNVDSMFDELDEVIRKVRLFNECPLRFKRFIAKAEIIGSEYSYNHDSSIPVGEAIIAREFSKLNLEKKSMTLTNKFIIEAGFPFTNANLWNCYGLYDSSYCQIDIHASFVILITCLEMLYLNNETNKKERLSKRCAIFLEKSKDKRFEVKEKIRSMYKKRSDFVHEGTRKDISPDDILFLRSCVRKTILRYHSESIEKRNLIRTLKSEVEAFFPSDLQN